MEFKKLLITGCSGFLGWNISTINSDKFFITGIYNSSFIRIPNIKCVKCDLTDFQCLKEIFYSFEPDAVIHAAAISDSDFCQVNRSYSYKTNVTATANIAGLCADFGIPFCFISTDLVFDGWSPPYKETDSVSPVNIYGEQKVAAEDIIAETLDSYAVCRLPLMFGNAPDCAKSFIQPLLKKLRNKEKVKLFVDEFRTPVSASDAAQGILMALRRLPGIVHLGGKEMFSRYEFGLKLADITQFDRSLIVPSYQNEISLPAPRPKNVCLDSTKAFALGFKPELIDKALSKINFSGII
ncbi:MAG TPA: NAD(P)-dependent oxidoreductase [Chitinispirillaceae bacterium]|nr:NAD(P)-dependent oxidoreductase [Chitinispirillaceae bacterium]